MPSKATDWSRSFAKLANFATLIQNNPQLEELLATEAPDEYEHVVRISQSPFFKWRPFGKMPDYDEDGLITQHGTCQVGLLASKSYEKWGQAGNRAGKTVVGLYEDFCDLLEVNPLTMAPNPDRFTHTDNGINMWIVSDTEETSRDIVQRTFVREFLGSDQSGVMWNLIDDGCEYNDRSGWKDNMLRVTSGNWAQFKYSTQKREVFQGVPLHKVHHDEVQPETIYNECKARLTDYGGYFLGTMTPVFDEKKGIPWIYEKLYKTRRRRGIHFYRWSMLDNPFIPQAYKERYIRSLDEDEVAGRVHGLFVAMGVKLAFRPALLDKIREGIQVPRRGHLTYSEDGQLEFMEREAVLDTETEPELVEAYG